MGNFPEALAVYVGGGFRNLVVSHLGGAMRPMFGELMSFGGGGCAVALCVPTQSYSVDAVS